MPRDLRERCGRVHGLVQLLVRGAAEASPHVDGLALRVRGDAVELVLYATRQSVRVRHERTLPVRQRRQERKVVEQLLVFLILLYESRYRIQRLLLEYLEVGERLDGGAYDRHRRFLFLVEVGGHGEGAFLFYEGGVRGLVGVEGRGEGGGVAGYEVGGAGEGAVGGEVLVGGVERAVQQQLGEPRVLGNVKRGRGAL